VTDTAVAPAPVSTRRERVGWYFYDWANSAFSTTVIAVFFSPYLTEVAKAAADCADEECGAARLYPLGVPVSPLSFYSYVLSLSVLLQVVVLPVVGAFTDRTRHRKKLLALFAYIGALATIGFFFVTGSNYLLGGVLFLIANVAFGASVVVYHSYLPSLGGPDERDRISSIGWAMGYLGGGLLLVINLAAYVFAPEDMTGLIVRISLASAGVWWAVFSTLPLIMLKDPEPHHIVRAEASAFGGGFKQLAQTLRELRAYPLTLFFLIAFLIYNDGVQTVIGVSSQYASDYLKLSDETRIITILIVQFTAFGGALLLGRIARTFGAWKTVLASLVLWIGVVGAAYFLPRGPVRSVPRARHAAGHRARGYPGLVAVAVQPDDPGWQGGRVLQLLRDQRQGHVVAGPAGLRHLAAGDRPVPDRDRLGRVVLRARLRGPAVHPGPPGHRRRRQHAPAGAVDGPRRAALQAASQRLATVNIAVRRTGG
jgi:Permeases of the major facilitator superfamily